MGNLDRHSLRSLEMPSRKLEDFTPNVLVKVAPACGRHRVRWGHHYPQEAHKALLGLPFDTAFTFAGRGTLLAS